MTFGCGITAESGRVAMDITGKDSLWETPIWWFKDNTQHPAIRHPRLARRQQCHRSNPEGEALAILGSVRMPAEGATCSNWCHLSYTLYYYAFRSIV
jgi:hypothetical protein